MTDIHSIINLNKHSKIPLHSQIKESVRSAILEGKLLPGDKLPTEDEICTKFHVSRPVVRQAYSDLAADRIIERKRGHGSYVKRMDVDNVKLYQLINFNEEMKILGKKPGTQLILSEPIPYNEKIFQTLKMDADEVCYKILRVRYADNLPFSLISNYVSLKRFEGIDRFDFAVESLYEVLEKYYDTRIYKSCRTIRSQIIEPGDANLLQVEKKTAAHIVISRDYNSSDIPVGISIEVFPGQTHEFSFTVYRD